MLLSVALASASPPLAAAQPTGTVPELSGELRREADSELRSVYAARGYRPIWLTALGTLEPGAEGLIALLDDAAIDEVDSAIVPSSELRIALARLESDASPAARGRAELALSRAFVDYVQAMRRAPAAAMTYEHKSLRPDVPARADALWSGATAPSLAEYVAAMGWMHPLYAPLRAAALAEGPSGTDPAVRANLARIRALPAPGKGRTILVDAASATLWMYDGAQVTDSMRVVVGKPDLQTPMLAGYVRHAIVNPYWNVPQDLVRGRIASNVLQRGAGYLKSAGYEVLSGWDAQASVIDAGQIDWRKVAKGESPVRVRQLPGEANAMGRVKYEFPNPLGIYLHDTPDKQLMSEDQRQFSSGCIRLEDAARLGRWLLGSPLPSGSGTPEEKIELGEIVPIYVTYLTVRAEGGRLAYGPDPYGKDGIGRTLARTAVSAALAR